MVKHTQTIHQLFRVFDHFVRLALKGLMKNFSFLCSAYNTNGHQHKFLPVTP